MFFKLLKEGNIQQGDMQATDRAAMKRESKRLFIIVIVLVAVFFAALAAVFLARPVYEDVGEGVYGNTPGNLANGGSVSANDGWIYYNSIDFSHMDDSSIYKMRPDGSEKTKLIDGLVSDINVADGWIYFTGDSGLYKMRTDGTGLSKLTDKASNLCMDDGWLYYVNIDKSGFYLCKIRTDGTGLTQLAKGASEITVEDGWVYYSDINDDFSIYKVRVDGTDKTKLSGRKSYQITVSGDYVYFITSGKEFCSDLYRIHTDGIGEIKLSGEVYESFNVSNGWIYYCNIDDKHESSLHKIRTDGTDDVKISDHYNAYLYVAGDWIYYYSNGWCRMKTDGTGNQRVD